MVYSGGKERKEEEEGPKLWRIFLFGLIGATATTYAVKTWNRTHSACSSWKTYRTSYNEKAAWKRYNHRLQEEIEEEIERVERIRRMQNVFKRARNKHNKSYESWKENGPGTYHQSFQRDDWYWKTESSFKDQRANNSRSMPTESGTYAMSHHYSVLGLDRSRAKPYSDAEVKTAFRAKAMEYHPDQNPKNREAAEAKFKDVMTSYEAIKEERKNGV
ncbi:hypothetical protein QJS10_CPB17g02627 [Acorus calamus]|uniref:J domain-containing protein n=1 Tax=Acorus calamus TaxID=4465 RepID=A0AAV9CVG4_ACOCL|nr:hypothetical protein QJS10_CPB17g02627 [Acorus calamus]